MLTPNELMRPIYDTVQETLAVWSLRLDLQKVSSAGFTRTCGRIYLRYYAGKRDRQPWRSSPLRP